VLKEGKREVTVPLPKINENELYVAKNVMNSSEVTAIST